MAQQQSINTSQQAGLQNIQHQIIMPVMTVNNVQQVKTENVTTGVPTLVNVQSYVVNNSQNANVSQQQVINNGSTVNAPVTPVTNVQQQTFNGTPSKGNASGTAASAPVNATQPNTDGPQQLLSKPRLMDLVRDVDPSVQLDDEVEEMILGMADDFMESIMTGACKIAKHRHAPNVEVRDVQLYLEKAYNMWIPGLGTDELRPYKRSAVTDAHKQRMALIRKAKKY